MDYETLQDLVYETIKILSPDLDATGVQTDEANAVHTAAFVGCTYHCG